MLIAIIIVFVLGYLAITLEHFIKINKAAIALLTGITCWTIYILSPVDTNEATYHLAEHLSEISGILFFLIGAMTIVELIDAHDGFYVITGVITTTNKRKLLWILASLAFILSAILDNLTTTIVLVSMLPKLIDDKKDRMLFIGIVIIAANAGGAWSPIGDVTTTMLWIGGRITAGNIILQLIFPSLVCLLVPLTITTFMIKGTALRPLTNPDADAKGTSKTQRNVIFFSGLIILLIVPVFKTLTHLPPYMGMLAGLAVLWIISEILHKDKDEEVKNSYSVMYALSKIDTPSILFFLGILIAVSSLQTTGQLGDFAIYIHNRISNINLMIIITGLLSAILDNVPLVAASIGMYDLQTYPEDHYFWTFLAYAAGTGGSALIIGSAAGIAAMGIEKINFFWYLKRISWLALLGYLAGAFTFILQSRII